MSSKKTSHYKLHQWEPSDNFLRREFNENFTTLDKAMAEGLALVNDTINKRNRVVSGFYMGTGEELHIELGGKPVVVLLEHVDGIRHNDSRYIYGGMLCQGVTALKGCAHIDDSGFTLEKQASGSNYGYYINPKNEAVIYLAVIAEK